MIIETEKIPHASYISSGNGQVEMELEDPFDELETTKGLPVILVVMFCDNLVVVIGTVKEYEKVEPDPELVEQEVFARVTVDGHSISISL